MVKALIVVFKLLWPIELFQVRRWCSYSLKNGHRTINLGTWQWVKWWTGTKAIFSSYPVDELDCGTSDVELMGATAVQTISNTHSSGKNTSLVLVWWACHILIPLPILFQFWETCICWCQQFWFWNRIRLLLQQPSLSIYCVDLWLMIKGRQSLQTLNP